MLLEEVSVNRNIFYCRWKSFLLVEGKGWEVEGYWEGLITTTNTAKLFLNNYQCKSKHNIFHSLLLHNKKRDKMFTLSH